MRQQEALNLLMMGQNVYLTGQAGSGKTYLLNTYINFLRKHKVAVAVTATTGIAATHLNGSTVHSWSGIGIKSELTRQDLSRISANINIRTRLQDTKVLIIDEISMFHSYRLDMVNQICKFIRQDTRSFGGLQVILCGDFFQLPPINEANYGESSFAYKSKAWEELALSVCYLNEQHRQQDESFLKLLNQIRSQEVDEYTFEKLSQRLNKKFASKFTPTKLYTHNVDVDAINNLELSKIKGSVHQYSMFSRGKKELVEALKRGCLAPEEIFIKIGASVMFIKNNPSKGCVNGTLGEVVGFDDAGYPVVETYSGREIVASPASWQFEENDKILAELGQVPLRLAWAITVHKCQGMSLDAAEIDLSKSFAYGMGYVALSRVRSLDGIKLLGINPNALMVDDNIVKLDSGLKRQSADLSLYLKQLGESQIRKKQKEFLQIIAPKDENINNLEKLITDLFTKFFG